MKRKMKLFLSLLILTTAMLLSVSDVRADALNLTLATPLSGIVGNTLSFSGTIVAPISNTGAVFLNADSLNLSGNFTLDDSAFFTNTPLSMNPGETFTGVLFTVTINPGVAPGIYNGFFTILGGSSPIDLGQISNAAAFQVVVVPEPTTMMLLGTGVAGLMFRMRKRQKNRG